MTLPKVTIVIPSYSEDSKPYLDLCIRAIKNQDYDPTLLDIVLSTPLGYAPQYEGIKTVHHPDPKRAFAEAVNYGVQMSDPESKYIMLLSDDTVITKDALTNLVLLCSSNSDELILNATSNCDNGWKYLFNFMLEKGNDQFLVTQRYFKMVDIVGYEEAMMNAQSLYLKAGILLADTLCFYATLIPKKIWNDIGPLDEQFKTGYEDSDYSHRAKIKGYQLGIAINALIWHFGGIATQTCLTDEITAENKLKFNTKWSQK